MSTLLLILICATCTLVSSIMSSIYGNDSGSFGEWKQDNNSGNNFYNLPYYTYTLNQITDKTALIYNASTVKRENVNATDHWFQFGNDRLTIFASNYGYIKIRQDETGPKFLNDFQRIHNQFGGGIGYLTQNNQLLLSTFYTGTHDGDLSIERDFSFYYRRYYVRSSKNTQCALDQTLIAPFGDDPVIISKVNIQGGPTQNLSYYEVYGGQMYQMLQGQSFEERRAYQWRNYKVSYENIDNGMSATYAFIGKPVNITDEPQGWMYDEQPPQIFLSIVGSSISLNDINISVGCDGDTFFGQYGAENPTFKMNEDTCNDINSSALIIQLSGINVDQATFYIIYGYVANSNGINQYSIKGLLDKYSNTNLLESLQENTAKQWYDNGIKFNTTNYPEIGREILWNYGMMRSSLSFYNSYNQTILDQGTSYRYISGFEGALRDPLIHVLPFIYTNPEIVKKIIRFSLKQIQPPFDNTDKPHNLPYGLSGNGIFDVTYQSRYPTDLEITVLWIVTEYILATKDIDFLDESINLNVFVEDINKNHTHSILDCLLNIYEYLSSYIGIGEHGVFRLGTGDLSDTFVILSTEGIPGYNQQDIIDQSESGLNTAMLAYILPRFYDILQSINISYPEMEQFAEQQINVIRDVLWNGDWLNRAWVPKNDTPDGTWLGTNKEGRIHVSPQSWVLMANILNQTQNEILINNIDKLLRNNSFGATNLNLPYVNPNINYPNGTAANGGVWYSRTGPLILGLSRFNASQAFDEWQRNSFAYRANMFPQLWPNIWSSSDVSTSSLVSVNDKQAIGTSNWPEFPILCTHSYSWPLYSFAAGIIGVTSTKMDNVIIQPAIPMEVGEFIFKSSLVDVRRDINNNYHIIYRPKHNFMNKLEMILDLSVVKNDAGNDQWIFRKQILWSHSENELAVDAYFDSARRLLM